MGAVGSLNPVGQYSSHAEWRSITDKDQRNLQTIMSQDSTRGAGAFWMALSLLGVGLTPVRSTRKPKISSDEVHQVHLEVLSRIPASLKIWRTPWSLESVHEPLKHTRCSFNAILESGGAK